MEWLSFGQALTFVTNSYKLVSAAAAAAGGLGTTPGEPRLCTIFCIQNMSSSHPFYSMGQIGVKQQVK